VTTLRARREHVRIALAVRPPPTKIGDAKAIFELGEDIDIDVRRLDESGRLWVSKERDFVNMAQVHRLRIMKFSRECCEEIRGDRRHHYSNEAL